MSGKWCISVVQICIFLMIMPYFPELYYPRTTLQDFKKLFTEQIIPTHIIKFTYLKSSISLTVKGFTESKLHKYGSSWAGHLS